MRGGSRLKLLIVCFIMRIQSADNVDCFDNIRIGIKIFEFFYVVELLYQKRIICFNLLKLLIKSCCVKLVDIRACC